MTLLFIGKQHDAFCQHALDFLKHNYPAPITVALGTRGDPFPAATCEAWQGDYIISYLSPWIIPAPILQRAHTASINFHPGPPEYPGIGCTNFAIYHQEEVFGVTCHHMAPRVDTGQIIAVRRFPLLPTDSVLSLTRRCYAAMLELFYAVATTICQHKPLPVSPETWQRKPYKRAELNALCKLTLDMSAEEIQRRVRAVTYPGAPGAYIEIAGIRFEPVSAEQAHG
jgi:methionyl-tRNA formyltransferase